MRTDLKKEARHIFEAGLRAVDPIEAVKRFLTLEKDTLVLGEQKLDLKDFEGIWAIGAGKASAAMAQAVEEVLGDRISGGLIIVKYDHLAPLRKIRLVEAGHPTPDENGWRATKELVRLVENLGHQDLVLFCSLGEAQLSCQCRWRESPWLRKWPPPTCF